MFNIFNIFKSKSPSFSEGLMLLHPDNKEFHDKFDKHCEKLFKNNKPLSSNHFEEVNNKYLKAK